MVFFIFENMCKGSILLDLVLKWMILSIFKIVVGMDVIIVFYDIGYLMEVKKIFLKYFIGEFREVSYYICDIKF